MALWPPSFLSSDKTSLSAGVIKVLESTAPVQIKNSHELRSVESTAISQRLIHGEVRTEVCKVAVWRIRASDCYKTLCFRFVQVF